MTSSSSLRTMTRFLWFGVVALFLTTETDLALAFRGIPNDHPFPGVPTKYFVLFIAVLPLVAGINGYSSVRRRLPSAGDDVISTLSAQFLISTVIAYVAVLARIHPLAQALRATLK